MAAELKRRKWTEQDLMAKRKGHPMKIELARKLRTESTMTLGWIANRLAVGTRGHLVQLLLTKATVQAQSSDGNQKSFN